MCQLVKYLFYAIVFDVAGNITAVGSSTSPAKSITTNIQNVTGITISPSSAQTKNIGDTFKITTTVSPSDANNKGITWSSSNSGVATIDSSGNVRCLVAGKTTITATAADGSSIKASLELTVRNPVNSISLSQSSITIAKDGFTANITLTIDPSDYSDNNISWTIGNTSIATISGSGKTRTITSTSTIGDTTLTVSAGGKVATCAIHVVNFTTQTWSTSGAYSKELPIGTYKLEVWGAQGGSNQVTGGYGGYSSGSFTVTNPTIVYIYVGGTTLDNSGGFNGGGSGGTSNTRGGGGATHIGLKDTILSSFSNDYTNNLLIVAGGGGGSGYGSYGTGSAGIGGGDNGVTGGSFTYSSETNYGGNGGSQSCGGSGGTVTDSCGSKVLGKDGKFGYGADGISNGSQSSGGGGGGLFGGGSGSASNCNFKKSGGSGGGSGFVNILKLTSTSTKAGNTSFPNVNGTGSETGHSGNGAAKITLIN